MKPYDWIRRKYKIFKVWRKTDDRLFHLDSKSFVYDKFSSVELEAAELSDLIRRVIA